MLLFPALTLDSRAKYFAGLAAAVLLGVLAEILLYVRRNSGAIGHTRLAAAFLHALQLLVGYAMMLVAMTVSSELQPLATSLTNSVPF